jgi:type III restriction enzyme
LEKEFIVFVDSDAAVASFIKILDYAHEFARILYMREDWQPATYIPDFLVRIGETIYMVETKAEANLSHPNVTRKRLGAIDWIEAVNRLKPEQRQGCIWKYVLLGERTFYDLRSKGASTQEILEYQLLTRAKVEGTLGDFLQ